MTPDAQLLDYLDKMGQLRDSHVQQNRVHYVSMETLLFRHGTTFPVHPNTFAGPKAPIRRCFSNCLSAATVDDDRLLYVEGVATSGVLPVHHAWLFNVDRGHIIDPMWANFPRETEQCAYRGIAFKLEYVHKCLRSSGSVFDNWKDRFPLECGVDNLKDKWISPVEFGLGC